MGTKDLIHKDLSKRPNHKELSRKGGLTKSKAKQLANKIKGLKNAKPEKQAEFLNQMLTNPEYSIQHILQMIKSINWNEASTKEKTLISKTLLDWHKTKHPITQKIEHSGKITWEQILKDLDNL